jgi:light-regulated signal transduction histidine kinase (bacteriophytochrome)
MDQSDPSAATVLRNLPGPAITSRKRKPMVRVSNTRHREHPLFSLTRSGIDVEPEYQERIFGISERLHTADGFSATGIGLALSHGIAERNQGRVRVDSEAGAGSALHFAVAA